MRTAWYDEQGAAQRVLQIGDLPDPVAGPFEVRVRLRISGVSPGDTKKRRGWLGSSMPYPRVVPHSDGAGVIDQVGDHVDRGRIGERVWVYNAQSYRAFGTAAQFVTVPADTAVPLAADVPDIVGACLGIPGITAHRAVFASGAVDGQTVLVHGALGAVGSVAAQLAQRAGATVICTVRRVADLDQLAEPLRARAVTLDAADPVAAIAAHALHGVDRIVEVAFSDNVDLDLAVSHNETVIAAYASREDRPAIPFWPMLFNNITIQLLGSDDFSPAAKSQAAADLTAAANDLVIPIREPYPLEHIAQAHDQVDADNRRRVVLDVTT